MKTFYRCSNNGVVALVDEEKWLEVERWKHRADSPTEPGKTGRWRSAGPDLCPGPIFTFAGEPIFHNNAEFLTGTFSLMDRLLNGHHVEEREFYVPFSNGTHWSNDEAGQLERDYRTTLEQAIRVFGLATPTEVQVKVAEATQALNAFAARR